MRAGNDLVYSTFLGGSDDEICYGLDMDDEENVYICGWTLSEDYPVTPEAYDPWFAGKYGDGFAAKLSSDCSQLIYGTFHGGYDLGFFNDAGASHDVSMTPGLEIVIG